MLDRIDRLSRSQPAPDTDVITRAVAGPALAALAVIHMAHATSGAAKIRSAGSRVPEYSRPR
jgi:hypothetical protein